LITICYIHLQKFYKDQLMQNQLCVPFSDYIKDQPDIHMHHLKVGKVVKKSANFNLCAIQWFEGE